MTRQIDQLENNQTYLQEIVERYGLEAISGIGGSEKEDRSV